MAKGELSILLDVDYAWWTELESVSRAARLLHIDALCALMREESDNGLVTTDLVVAIAAPASRAKALRWAQELVDSGAWRPSESGYILSIEGIRTHLRGTNRPHIRRAVRAAVFERDGYACVSCGSTERLSLDHIKPYSHGGRETVENLRVLCMPCNWSRGAGRW